MISFFFLLTVFEWMMHTLSIEDTTILVEDIRVICKVSPKAPICILKEES